MLTTLVLAAALAVGQTPESPVFEHLKDLECFIGDWEGKAVLPESPNASPTAQKWAGKTIVIKLNVSWAPGNSAQIVQSAWEVPGDTTIQSTWLRGWDTASKSLKVYWFTSHKGAWSGTMCKEGDKWLTDFTGINLDGSRCTGVSTIVFSDADHFIETDSKATVDGKALPDVEYQFTRVKSEPPVPNSERLKDLGFLIGTWESRSPDGVTNTWTFRWAADKNLLENEIVMHAPDGKVAYASRGTIGWDAGSRQIVNWTFNNQGNPENYIWVQTGEKTWRTWPTGGGWTAVVESVDANSWSIGWDAGKSDYKRKADK